MFDKASELLEQFIAIESREVSKMDMPHMPTLGSAYEEITKQGIDQEFIIPKGLNLKVVSGFISIGDKLLKQQIDGMLVHGEGKQYGRTSEYIYSIDQVLCIFEVKKTLNKSDYIDAFDHLRIIRSEYSEYFESKFQDPDFEPDISVASKHFSQITGRNAPTCYGDIHSLSKSDGILFYSLVQETLAPCSIIHGYGGYTTEAGMRNAFLDILTDKGEVSGNGLGVPSLPTLVISNHISIVKANGMPFLGISHDRQWAALVSMRANSARIMLEIIWSKISMFFDVKMPWGDDSKIENMAPLLYAIPLEKENEVGWLYKSVELKESELKVREVVKEWQPERIDKDIQTVFYRMMFNGGILDINALAGIAADNDEEESVLLLKLEKTFLFKRDEEYIRPITPLLIMVEDDNENCYLSSSREHLDVWCDKYDISKNYMQLMIME
ncbi:DUF6602 domain-containing protein [Enterobacter kobei]|uniref:DUF6602 domain-containing protein n=2 Tax=Enterobacter kobei TaxID=208224 RepID=UPI00388E6F33